MIGNAREAPLNASNWGRSALRSFASSGRIGSCAGSATPSFPFATRQGQIRRAGGIAQDITRHEGRFVYVVDGEETSRRDLSPHAP